MGTQGSFAGVLPGVLNKGPEAPDPAQVALKDQQTQAQQFRSNIPTMQQNLSQQMAQGVNKQIGMGINNVKANTNSRGLLTSGINQGMQGQVRQAGSNQLAQGRSTINTSLQNEANQMDSSAISSGLAMQNAQQQIQNTIYQQAMTNMMNQNNMYGSLAGAGILAAAVL